MKFLKKKWFWISFFAAAAVICLIVAGGLIWLNSGDARKRFITFVNEKIPGNIALAEHHISVFSGTVLLSDVVLSDPDGNTLFKMKHFSASFGYREIIDGTFRIKSLIVDSPECYIHFNENDRLNILDAFPAPPPSDEKKPKKQGGFPVNIILDEGRIIDGRIDFRQKKDSLKITAKGIDLNCGGNLASKSGDLTLSITHALFMKPGMRFETETAESKLVVRNGDIRHTETKVGSKAIQMLLSGTVGTPFDSPNLDMDLKLTVFPAELRNLVSVDSLPAGKVTIQAQVRGNPNDPRGSLRLFLKNDTPDNIPVESMELTAILKERILSIGKLDLVAPGGAVSARGEADFRSCFPDGFLHASVIDALAWTFSIDHTRFDLEKFPLTSHNWKGTLEANALMNGEGNPRDNGFADVTIHAVANQITSDTVSGSLNGELDAAIGVREKTVFLNSLNSSVNDLKFLTEGCLDPVSGNASVRIQALAKDLYNTAAPLGVSELSGAFRVNADVEAENLLNGEKPEIQGKIVMDGRDVAWKDLCANRLQGTLFIDDGKINTSDITVFSGDSRIHFSGYADFFRNETPWFRKQPVFAFQVLSEEFHPEDFMKKISGVIGLFAEAEGDSDHLSGQVSLTGNQLGFDSISIGDLEMEGRLDPDGVLFLSLLRLKNRESLVEGKGKMRLFSGYPSIHKEMPVQMAFDFSEILPKNFMEASPVDGRIDGRLLVEGPVRSLTGILHIDGKALAAGDILLGESTSDIRFSEGTLYLDSLRVQNKNSIIDGRAEVNLLSKTGYSINKNPDFQVELNAESIELNDFISDISGNVSLTVDGRGTFREPSGNLVLSGKKIESTIQNIETVDLQASFTENEIQWNRLDIGLPGEGNISGNGRFGLDRTFAARLFSNGIPIENLDFMQSAANGHKIEGILGLNVKAKGTLDRPVIDCRLSMNTLRIDGESVPDFKIDVRSAKSRDVLKDKENTSLMSMEEGNSGFVDAVFWSGMLEKQKGKIPLAAKIDSNIPLRVISPFIPYVSEVGGHVRLRADITGTGDAPLIDGNIELTNVKALLPESSQQLSNIGGKIRLEPDGLSIDNIHGNLDTGSFRISGNIAHERFSPKKIDIDLSAKKLPIQVPDTLDLTTDLTLNISGTPDHSNVRGKLDLIEGLYYQDMNLDKKILMGTIEKKRKTAPVTQKIDTPFLKDMDLDIQVTHREPFVVDNDLANLFIIPDLRIEGKLHQPVISGRTQVESGTVTYLGKTFSVEKGVIDFLNPYRTEPTLDIKAETTVRHYTIFLNITGVPDALRFQLRSEPAEEHGDIVSLLLVNKTTRELSSGEGGASKSSAQILADFIGSNFGEEIENTTGLDIVEVKSGNGEESDGDGVSVTIGKEITRRMTIKYEIESREGELVQRGIAEYKLLDNLLLNGFQDTRGIYGGELQYRLEFR